MKTRARAISIGRLVASLVVRVAIVVVAATSLLITTASTSIIASSVASALKGPLPKVKVIGTYKTLFS